MPIGGEICAPWRTRFAVRDEEWPFPWIAARREVRVQQTPDVTGEEQLVRLGAFAVQTDAALDPVDVLEIDGERLLAAQAAVVEQREQRAVSYVVDAAQGGFHLLRVKRAVRATAFALAHDPHERIVREPLLRAQPAHEAAQCRQAPIVSARREVVLGGDVGDGDVAAERRDGLAANARQQRREILRVALAGPSREGSGR